MNDLEFRRAGMADLDALLLLFDAYRIFYGQSSDLIAARSFLEQHIRLERSVIFMAYANAEAVGFTQLYPSYSSVRMSELWILNDLYVDTHHRSRGIASALMKAAEDFARQRGAGGLTLETANDNPAQKLYEKRGWIQDADYKHYSFKIS